MAAFYASLTQNEPKFGTRRNCLQLMTLLVLPFSYWLIFPMQSKLSNCFLSSVAWGYSYIQIVNYFFDHLGCDLFPALLSQMSRYVCSFVSGEVSF